MIIGTTVLVVAHHADVLRNSTRIGPTQVMRDRAEARASWHSSYALPLRQSPVRGAIGLLSNTLFVALFVWSFVTSNVPV